MIRKTTNGDISDDEFEAVLKPFLYDYYNFIYSYVIPKEMLFFTYDEFQQFLSVEEYIKFRCGFQLLYYCGLRIGKLKGLT